MTPSVPNRPTVAKPSRLFQDLSELLLSGLEFLGASVGWIGLQEALGGLTFPVRVGPFPDSWLPWQQAYGSVWGFTITDEIALLNDLAAGAKRPEASLHNLLSCPLIHDKQILGHVALANKAHRFTAEDARVLQGLAHHLVRLLVLGRKLQQTPIELPSAWRLLLDRSTEGVLVLDESGVLLYANAAWLHWTGFRADELIGQTAPFPFWVSQCDLVQAISRAPAPSAGALPFRRCDRSLLWCFVEMSVQQWDDHQVTIAFLRRTPALSPAASAPILSSNIGERKVEGCDGMAAEKVSSLRSPSLNWLPLLLDLDHGVEGWEGRWEERTGLSVRDVEGGRCELVLDWLFPQQHDRNRVADCFHHPRSTGYQLILEIASPDGGRPTLCTFLPLPSHTATAGLRRWLLLLGEVERSAEPKILDGVISRELAATDEA